MTTQSTQTTNIVISSQNTITTAMLNTTIQPQSTTILPNIFNLTSQLMGMTTGATARGSNLQNNTISNVNTGGGHFLHFDTVGANPFGGFGAFENNNNNLPPENNNNNNLPPSPLPLLGLGEGFNLPPRGNTEGLDSNVAVLVNALTGINLGINHIKKE